MIRYSRMRRADVQLPKIKCRAKACAKVARTLAVVVQAMRTDSSIDPANPIQPNGR